MKIIKKISGLFVAAAITAGMAVNVSAAEGESFEVIFDQGMTTETKQTVVVNDSLTYNFEKLGEDSFKLFVAGLPDDFNVLNPFKLYPIPNDNCQNNEDIAEHVNGPIKTEFNRTDNFTFTPGVIYGTPSKYYMFNAYESDNGTYCLEIGILWDNPNGYETNTINKLNDMMLNDNSKMVVYYEANDGTQKCYLINKTTESSPVADGISYEELKKLQAEQTGTTAETSAPVETSAPTETSAPVETTQSEAAADNQATSDADDKNKPNADTGIEGIPVIFAAAIISTGVIASISRRKK